LRIRTYVRSGAGECDRQADGRRAGPRRHAGLRKANSIVKGDGEPPNQADAADEAGNMVGKVLHVGTGFPRLMVVTFDTCAGPRTYAGVVSAYHETVTSNFERLTDEKWTNQLAASPPVEVPWMADLVSR
jgi:hypothetical protein